MTTPPPQAAPVAPTSDVPTPSLLLWLVTVAVLVATVVRWGASVGFRWLIPAPFRDAPVGDGADAVQRASSFVGWLYLVVFAVIVIGTVFRWVPVLLFNAVGAFLTMSYSNAEPGYVESAAARNSGIAVVALSLVAVVLCGHLYLKRLHYRSQTDTSQTSQNPGFAPPAGPPLK